MGIFDSVHDDSVKDEKSLATKEDRTFLKKFEEIESYYFQWARAAYGDRWLTTQLGDLANSDNFDHYLAGRIPGDITPKSIEFFCRNTQLYHESLGSGSICYKNKILTRPSFGLFISTLVQQSFDNGHNNFVIPLGPYENNLYYRSQGNSGFLMTAGENRYTKHVLVNTGHCLHGEVNNPIKITYEGYSYHSQVHFVHNAHITYTEPHNPSMVIWEALRDCTIVLKKGVPHDLFFSEKPYQCTFVVPDKKNAERLKKCLGGKNNDGSQNENRIFIEQNGIREQYFANWQRLKRKLSTFNPFKK